MNLIRGPHQWHPSCRLDILRQEFTEDVRSSLNLPVVEVQDHREAERGWADAPDIAGPVGVGDTLDAYEGVGDGGITSQCGRGA